MSDAKTKFDTGAVRDSQTGKPKFFEAVSWESLWEFGEYMESKAQKYGHGNFKKGIPAESYLESLNRHVVKLMVIEDCRRYNRPIPAWAEEHENHPAAIIFNTFGFMHARNTQPSKVLERPATKEELQQAFSSQLERYQATTILG